jgi:autotransporter-associated beta strand protein
MRFSWWRRLLRLLGAQPQRRRPLRRRPLGFDLLEDRLVPSTINIWTDGHQNGKWDDKQNWSLGSVPAAGDVAQFTGAGANGNDDVIINPATVTVAAIDITAGYTGTITDKANLLTLSGDFTQAGGKFIVNGSSDMQVAGNWSAGGTFTAGSGTVTFDGVAQTITSGGNSFANLTHAATGTLTLQDALTVTGTLTNTTGTVDANGHAVTAGTLTLASDFTAATSNLTVGTGDVTLTAGTFTAPGAAESFQVSGDFTISGGTFAPNGGTVTFNGSGQNLTTGGSTFANVTHNGTGTLTLQDALTLTGTLTNTAGTLNTHGNAVATGGLSLADNFSAGGAGLTVGTGGVTESGGTFTAPGTGKTFTDSGNFTVSGGAFTANSGTITFNGAAQTLTSAGNAFANLTHNGTGTLTLQDALTVNGTLTNTAGTLDANGNAVSAATLSVADNFTAGTANLTIGTGGLTLTGGTFTAPGAANSLSDGGNLTISGGTFSANGGTVTLNGATQSLTSGGTTFANVVHNGTGTLTLQDALTASGTLTNTNGTLNANAKSVSAGTLSLADDFNAGGSFLTVGTGGLTLTGGTFTAPGPAKSFTDSGDFTVTGGTFNANGGTVQFNGAAQNLTSGGNAFTNLQHNGTGTLTLHDALSVSGGLVNTAGALAANGNDLSTGSLSLADSLNAGTSNVAVGTGGLTLSGGTLTAPGSSKSFSDAGNFSVTGGTITANGGTVTMDGAAQTLATGGSTLTNLTHNGTGTLSVQSALNLTGTLTNTAGTLNTNGNEVAALALALADSFNAGTSNVTIGTGGVAQTAGTFTAPVSTKAFSDSGNFSVTGGTFTANGGTLLLNGAAQSLTSGGNSFANLTHNATGTLTLNDALTVTGTLTNTAGTLDANGNDVAAGTLVLADNFSAGTSNLSVGTGGLTLSAGTFTAPGSGKTFTVGGNFSVTGGAFFANGGTVTFDGATQTLTSGGNAFANLTHNGTGTLTPQDTLTVTGTLTNAAATLDLTTLNVTAAATQVLAGKLLVNGILSSPVNLSNPGILAGTGTIAGNVSGGTIAPGDPGIGVLTINGNLNQPASVLLQVNAPYATPGVDFDQVIVSGTVDLSGTHLIISGVNKLATPQQLVPLIINNGPSPTITDGGTSPSSGAPLGTGGAKFAVFYNGGDANDVVLVDISTPILAFVSGTFAGLNPGKHIADADFGTPGNQPAFFGVNAFATIGDALAAITNSGQVIVNDGTYPEAVNVTSTRTLTVTANAAVTVDALVSATGTMVQINGTSLTVGDVHSTNIAGVVTGTGQFIKQGSGTVTLSAADTYTGATNINAGTLQVSGSLSNNVGSVVNLNGAATLDGAGVGQVLRPVIVTATGAGAAIANITVQTSTTTVDGITVQAGADNVTISSTRVTGNRDGIVAQGVQGLQLTNDSVTANSGNGLNANLTGIGSTITGSHLDNNGRGLLVAVGTGALAVTNTTFSNNTTNGAGGGIDLASGAASVTIAGSLIASNTASGLGSGIRLDPAFTGSLSLVNSTVAGNSADGIDVAGGTLTLEFATLAFNKAGGLNNTAAAANVVAQDSLIAANATFDYQGPITSNGNNLIQRLPGAATVLIAGDLTNQAALLAPLGNYGGPTQTVALLPGSAALGAGAPIATVTTDQRGIARPSAPGTTPDIGAFQSQGFNVTVGPAGPNPAPVYRGLIDNYFLQADGVTPQNFQASVSSLFGEPVVGGRVLFGTTPGTGGDSATANPNLVIQGVSVANSTIQLALPLGVAVGQTVIYDDGGGTNKPIGGLVEGGTYVIASITGTAIKLNDTSGKPITLTAAGTGANQTLTPAITNAGTALAVVRANNVASPADGTPYSLTASAGAQNNAQANILFNQKVTSLPFNGAPQNVQSGGVVPFNVGAGTQPQFSVTLMDQENTPQPVVVSNMTVTLKASFDTLSHGALVPVNGTINAISGPGVTLSKGTATATTTQGVASFQNLQIFQSAYNSAALPGYALTASFTNPAPDKTVAASDSSRFSVMPLNLAVTASNFAGFLQKAFNIIVAASNRGEIRLVNITAGSNGLQTNQVKVQAFDFALVNGKPSQALSTTYDGPVTLSAAGNTGVITLLYNNAPYTNTPFFMTKGSVVISNITPNTSLGAFTLAADTTTAAGDPIAITVTSKTNKQSGSFIRINLGRQRGR